MKKNLLYALAANIVAAAFSWLQLLYLIRFGVKADVGILALAQTIALPVHMFFTLKMRTVQASDAGGEFQAEDYVLSRIILAFLNIFSVVALAAVLYWDEIYYLFAVTAFGISYSLVIVREYYVSVMQISLRNDYFFVSNIAQGLLGLVAFSLTYLYFDGVAEALMALAMTRVFGVLFDAYLCRSNVRHGFIEMLFAGIKARDRSFLLIKKSLPLGVVAIVGAMFTSIPRYFVEAHLGVEVLGIYATVMSLVVVLNLFSSSFSQALLPVLANNYLNDLKAFKRNILNWLLIIGLSIVLFMVLIDRFDRYILSVFFGVEYTQYTREFFWAMMSGCVLVVFHFANLLLNVQRSYKVQMPIYLVCAVVTFALSHLWVKEFGVLGAIYATLVCSITGITLCVICFGWNVKRAYE